MQSLLALAIAWTFVIIAIILSENRSPVRSLAWVTVLLLLPVAGLILYLFFGRNLSNLRMINSHQRRKIRRRERACAADVRTAGLSPAAAQLAMVGRSLADAQLYTGNTIDIFTDGAAKMDALAADLERARSSIHIQYYIFEDDSTGRRIGDILMRKAAQGVKVRLIYDYIGSFSLSNRYLQTLRKAGVEVYPFFELSFRNLANRINWRNHRKIVVVDNIVAYIGGMNIADRYTGNNYSRQWRDTHLRMQGNIVTALQGSFLTDWSYTAGHTPEPDSDDMPSMVPPSLPGSITGAGAQLLTAGPNRRWPNIALAYTKAIGDARKRVFIQTPYFLPSESLLSVLQSVALSHVDVRIMIPEQTDSHVLSYASASYIDACLKANIKVYMYTAGMLHSKTIIIDDDIASVGSSNFDFRSFDYNFEANVFIYSKEFNNTLAAIFEKDLISCRRIHATQWRHRPLHQKALESVTRLLSPVL